MNQDNIQTLSVSDAEQQLVHWSPIDTTEKDLPTQIVEVIDSEDDGTKVTGTAAEYHNLASEYARKDLYDYARIVAIAGTRKYKYNVDLLADIVKFGSQSQAWESCKKAYDRLQDIGKKKWTWRTYTFAIDYLQSRMEQEDAECAKLTYAEAMKLSESYKGLRDERAWVAEAELYLFVGETDKAITTLKDGVKKIAVAPQCCLKLGDLLLERGRYHDVIKYAAIGARGTAQEQPTASTGYLYYISALAKDALIHQDAFDNPDVSGKGFLNSVAVSDALLDYDIAKSLMSDRPIFYNNIRQRTTILTMKSGLTTTQTESHDKEKIVQEILHHFLENSEPPEDVE